MCSVQEDDGETQPLPREEKLSRSVMAVTHYSTVNHSLVAVYMS